jgi:hypothetical protein
LRVDGGGGALAQTPCTCRETVGRLFVTLCVSSKNVGRPFVTLCVSSKNVGRLSGKWIASLLGRTWSLTAFPDPTGNEFEHVPSIEQTRKLSPAPFARAAERTIRAVRRETVQELVNDRAPACPKDSSEDPASRDTGCGKTFLSIATSGVSIAELAVSIATRSRAINNPETSIARSDLPPLPIG